MDEKTIEAIKLIEAMRNLIIDILVAQDMITKERDELREIINVMHTKANMKEQHE